MFVDRQWYRHPLYDPMVIQTGMLHFIEPVCKQVGMNDPDQELLSPSYGYANHFCGIPPWHDYVQTYFDTTSQQTMNKFLQELRVSRFGGLGLDDTRVYSFHEKPSDEGGWINGGFFVLSPKVFSEIESEDQMFEREPIEALVAKGEVHAFLHRGFWQPMDTLRDKQQLDELWSTGKAPWKTW